MPAPAPRITLDPKSPIFDNLDEAANALATSFPGAGNETAGMIFKGADGKYRYSTTVPGGQDNFSLTAAIPKDVGLGAIVHSHPGTDSFGQVFSPNDLKTADQLKLPSYIRFLESNVLRVYRPTVTKTESMQMPGNRFRQVVARGDELKLVDPNLVRAQIAQQLAPTTQGLP